MAACKACMAVLVWITTPAGKSIPAMLPRATTSKKPRVGSKKNCHPKRASAFVRIHGRPSQSNGVGYVPHWATCPCRADSSGEKNG